AASKATRLAAMPAGGKTPAADVTVNIYARKFFNPAANRCFCLPRRPCRHGKGRSPGKCSEAANHITARTGDVVVCHDGAFIPPRGIGQAVISSGLCFLLSDIFLLPCSRSEERRVGKECRSR